MNQFPLCLSLGGRYVKVWDLLKQGQPLVSLKNHHKTVTSLCLSSSGQRLLSASLDRCVHRRIYTMRVLNETNSSYHCFDVPVCISTVFLSNAAPLCLSRHVKVYSTTNYKVVHNFDYAASILSLALAVRLLIQSFSV